MKLSEEKIKECADWVRINGLVDHGGATKIAFCKALDIGVETLRRWFKESSEFSEAIKKAKEYYAENLEGDLVASLSKAARGYTYEKKRMELGDRNGETYIKKKSSETINVAPNVAAGIFLLTNIAPERWKNRQMQDINANVDADVKNKTTYNLKDIPDDMLLEMADKLQDAQAEREKKIKENGEED